MEGEVEKSDSVAKFRAAEVCFQSLIDLLNIRRKGGKEMA